MPVAPHYIPLDTAKSWAKRLLKHSQSASLPFKLNTAQKAVANMLGFDDWHHLNQNLNAGTKSSIFIPTSQKQWEILLTQILRSGARLSFKSTGKECQLLRQYDFQAEELVFQCSTQQFHQGLKVLCSEFDPLNIPKDYAREKCSLPVFSNISVQMLQTQKSDFEAIVQAPSVINKPLSDIHLSQESNNWITKLVRENKIFVVAGTTRSGRTTLLNGIANTVGGSIIMDELSPHNFPDSMTKPLLCSIHSLSSGVPQRLTDFGLPLDGLTGWAYTRLFPVLCASCSLPSSYGREKGTGCCLCMHGYVGCQQLCDVWSYTNGHQQLEVSLREQLIEHIENGEISQADAENLIGPLSGLSNWESEFFTKKEVKRQRNVIQMARETLNVNTISRRKM